jgi:hypothetical protein
MTKETDRIFSRRAQAWIWFAASFVTEAGSNLAQALKGDAAAFRDPLTWILCALGVAAFLRQTFADAPNDSEEEPS